MGGTGVSCALAAYFLKQVNGGIKKKDRSARDPLPSVALNQGSYDPVIHYLS